MDPHDSISRHGPENQESYNSISENEISLVRASVDSGHDQDKSQVGEEVREEVVTEAEEKLSGDAGDAHDDKEQEPVNIPRQDTPESPFPPVATDIEQDGRNERCPAARFFTKRYWLPRFRDELRVLGHVLVFLAATAWWIASLVLHAHDRNWVIPFLVWFATSFRLALWHIQSRRAIIPFQYIWKNVALRFVKSIPESWRLACGAFIVVCVYVIGAFATPESPNNTRVDRAISLLGIAVFLFALWVFSKNRKKIQWHTVIVGMLLQFLVALFVLRTRVGYNIFNFVSRIARQLLGFSSKGTAFLTEKSVADTVQWFIVTVIPAIIFFVSFVQAFFHFGIIQWCVVKFATVFFWCMRVSGVEAVVAAASPFIGQGESAMMIRPFVNHLTIAELHQVMCSGFATIAGSVLVSYISIGVDPQAMVSSCVMSIPASLAMSKIRWPEEEETTPADRVHVPEDEENRHANVLHAITNGAWIGLKIGATVASCLLCIISLIALINGILGWVGRYINIAEPPLTLEMIIGYLCYPIAFLLGASRKNEDIYKVARLIGLKLVSNEFVAYSYLQSDEYASLSPRSRLVATYALCGFANLASLGNQIGVLGQLAPGRSGDISRVAFSAMLTGALSTFTSASIAGLVATDQSTFGSSSNKQPA